MKLLLISSTDTIEPFLDTVFEYLNVHVIHYDNPIKAMDNLEELQPELVIFSAIDFPRHWKPFVVFLRNSLSRRESVFILLINDAFPVDEADKAEHLQVNAILDEDLTSESSIQRVRALVRRYHQPTEGRRYQRLLPSGQDRVAFAFANPYNMVVVFGRVIDLSVGGLQFAPYDPQTIETIDTFGQIDHGTLQLGTTFYRVQARVVRVQQTIALEFIDLAAETEQAIIDFVEPREAGTLAQGFTAGSDLDAFNLTTVDEGS